MTFSDGTPLDANAVAKNFDTYGLGNKALRLPVSEVINHYDHSEVLDAVRGAQISLTPQDPAGSLNPVKTIGEQVAEIINIHQRLPRELVRLRVVE